MKIFVSQPMNGRTKEKVMEEREKYVDLFIKKYGDFINTENFEVIENYEKPYAPENAKRLWYLADSLKLMSEADYVIFVPGWKKANGCKIEMMCCKLYGVSYVKM